MPDPAFGVYVHVPFCAKKCDYCAFATWTDRHHLTARYLAALDTDIERLVAAGMPAATSIFVGGGTPSLVDPVRLAAVLAGIPRAGDCEITIECNPDTVTARHIRAYRDAGVDRLSLGVQSMVPHVLAALGRTHDPAAVRRSCELARQGGITNLNLDLIYGGAGESLADWETSLDRALELDPTHVSAYALTVEAGTPLAADASRHPDDDDQADKYLLATDRLGAAGYEWYEISNWSRPGRRCRHNLLYWTMGEYQGLGCAAHSHREGRRFWNVRTPERYVEAVESGRSTEAASESLGAEERRIEGLQLLLRTTEGVPEAALDVAPLEGLVERRAGRVVLTVAGRLLANEIALRLR